MRLTSQKHFPVPQDIKDFASFFEQKGHSLFIVGGAVRDWLLCIPNDDFDFATDATPEEVMDMFHKVIPTGIKHGTVTVLFRKQQFEVTTFRTEGDYQDHRHPGQVQFVRNLEEDLKRRDFTINAFAANAYTGQVVDLHNGIQDLTDKTIRAIGNAQERFTEDALRMMRGCRFASKLGFTIEHDTLDAMQRLAPTLSKVSNERIRDELLKILNGRTPLIGLTIMRDCKILDIILPELTAGIGIEQKGFHTHDVYTHNILACQSAADLKAPLKVRIAALLHDIGKPETRKLDDGVYTFHQHEFVSEKQAKIIMDRLKFPHDERDEILNLIRNHMFHYTYDWTDGAVRRFIARVGQDHIHDLFLLRLSDQQAIAGTCDFRTLEDLDNRIARILEENNALSIKDLVVNGKDLMSIGVKPGPTIGTILNLLLETVMDDPSQNEKDRLLTIARNYLKTLF